MYLLRVLWQLFQHSRLISRFYNMNMFPLPPVFLLLKLDFIINNLALWYPNDTLGLNSNNKMMLWQLNVAHFNNTWILIIVIIINVTIWLSWHANGKATLPHDSTMGFRMTFLPYSQHKGWNDSKDGWHGWWEIMGSVGWRSLYMQRRIKTLSVDYVHVASSLAAPVCNVLSRLVYPYWYTALSSRYRTYCLIAVLLVDSR